MKTVVLDEEGKMQWVRVTKFLDLFEAHEKPDGSRRVVLSTRLQLLSERLKKRIDIKESFMLEAIQGCHELPWDSLVAALEFERPQKVSSNPFEKLAKARSGRASNVVLEAENRVKLKLRPYLDVAQSLQAAIGADLRKLASSEVTSEEKSEIKKEMLGLVERAVEIFENPLARAKANLKAKTVAAEVDGVFAQYLWEIIVIECARLEVYQTGCVPTKGKLLEIIQRKHPESTFSDRKWTQILGRAGLKGLPHDKPFTQPPKKAAKRKKRLARKS